MSKKLNQLKMVYWTYFAIVAAYLVYGYASKSGLYALLIDQQLKMFGKAQVSVAVFLPLIVLMLPVVPLASYVRKKEREERLRDPKSAAAIAAGLRAATATEQRFYWIWITGFAALPFVISLAAYVYMTAADANDQKRPIYHLDLASSADLPAGDVKFIEVAGVFQQDSEYDLTESGSGTIKTTHRYAPLTEPGWTPDRPVKFFMHFKNEGDQRITISHLDKKSGRMEIMPPRGPFNSTFGGELSQNGLPDYVKSAFERRGITIADRYYSLDWKGELNTPVASKYSGQMYYLIPFLGAFFSLVVLAGGGIAFVNRKRQRARAGLE